MRWAILSFAIAIAVAPRARAEEWYSAGDLDGSLRAPERRAILTEASIARADELPMYELTVNVADDLRSFDLEETAWITNRTGQPLGDIAFRIYANAHTAQGEAPLVEILRAECFGGACTSTQSSPSAVVVRPAQPIAPSARVQIHFSVRGRMREIDAQRTTMLGQGLEGLTALSGGHGDGDYGLLAHSADIASMYGFFPVLARLRDGRWEESDGASVGDLGSDDLFHVRARVRVPDGVAIAGSGLTSDARVVGNRTERTLTAGFIRDFAMVMGPHLASRTRRVGDITVRSWFAAGNDESGARVLDAAAQAVTIFQRRFGPYPYTELDLAEAPLIGGAGGVEFSGFATVATMLYRPLDAQNDVLTQLLGGAQQGTQQGNSQRGPDVDERRRSMLEFVTAHEVAHQWWHGLVGSDSELHPFADESLAQWSAMLYMEERYGRDRARRESDEEVAAGYHVMRLLGRPDAAVDRSTSTFDDAVVYGGLVYGKGPYLYPALRDRIGDRAFFAALHDHVRENRFRTPPPRALFDRMAQGRNHDAVNALVVRWLDEAHGDDDLGQPDLGRMLGLGAGGGNDAATQMIQQILGQLGSANGGTNGGGDGGDVVRGLLDLLQQGGQ